MTYYIYNEASKQLTAAPRVISALRNGKVCRIANAPARDYAALTPPAYPKADIQPNPLAPEGKRYVLDGYELNKDNQWISKYRLEDIPAPDFAEYDAAMEEFLYSERAGRGYTTREPTLYIHSSNPRWKQDAEDWEAHIDEVMTYAQQLINEVKNGTRPQPTLEEFKAGIPRVLWQYAE